MSRWSDFKLLYKREGSFANFLSNWSRASFRPMWRMLNHVGITSDFYMILLLRMNAKRIPRVPLMSAKADYPSLHTLYDESRTTYTRLLPRKKQEGLPPVEDVADLFRRKDNFQPETNRNSSLLFPYYAQWFSHQFFNTQAAAKDSATTNLPVGFNLSQLYGSPNDETRLREFRGGRLKTSGPEGDELPPLIDNPMPSYMPDAQVFDMGVVLFNMLPGVAAIHVVMLRNHNRNAAIISKANPAMDDEELFQKAKLVSIAQVLVVTMEDYVNKHILSTNVEIHCRPQVVNSFMWNRLMPRSFIQSNSISMEFNLLYRWHQLLPDKIKVIDNFDPKVPHTTLEGVAVTEIDPIASAPAHLQHGVEAILASGSLQRAGKLTLMNTNDRLVDVVVLPGLRRARDLELASLNDYRELFGMARLTRFEEICDDPKLAGALRDVYGSVDKVEYYPGIFAEEKLWGGIHGATLSLMGVSCTYSGIFSSRLLLPEVFRPETFSKAGWDIIHATTSLQDLVAWNTKLKSVSFHVAS